MSGFPTNTTLVVVFCPGEHQKLSLQMKRTKEEFNEYERKDIKQREDMKHFKEQVRQLGVWVSGRTGEGEEEGEGECLYPVRGGSDTHGPPSKRILVMQK